jgi:hypothetical protein
MNTSTDIMTPHSASRLYTTGTRLVAELYVDRPVARKSETRVVGSRGSDSDLKARTEVRCSRCIEVRGEPVSLNIESASESIRARKHIGSAYKKEVCSCQDEAASLIRDFVEIQPLFTQLSNSASQIRIFPKVQTSKIHSTRCRTPYTTSRTQYAPSWFGTR